MPFKEAERKKHEQVAKRKRAEDVFNAAKKSRKGALKKLGKSILNSNKGNFILFFNSLDANEKIKFVQLRSEYINVKFNVIIYYIIKFRKKYFFSINQTFINLLLT